MKTIKGDILGPKWYLSFLNLQRDIKLLLQQTSHNGYNKARY